MDVALAATCTTWEGSAAYAPREPERTVLYRVLQDHLESFLERAQADGRNLPSFVVRELRGFLRCGIRAYGFLRVRCKGEGYAHRAGGVSWPTRPRIS